MKLGDLKENCHHGPKDATVLGKAGAGQREKGR